MYTSKYCQARTAQTPSPARQRKDDSVIAKKFLYVSLMTFCIAQDISALSNLARNDAYPVFSTLDPHAFLYTREKMDMKDLDYGTENFEFVGLSITPFGQTADMGKDYDSTRTSVCEGSCTVPLGDVTGRWSMIPMTFNNGNACGNGVYPCDLSCTLTRARSVLFPATTDIYVDPQHPDNTAYETANNQGFNNPNAIDPNERFGFFSNELKYTKRGIRLELDANIGMGFGFSVQAGYVDIRQILLSRSNLTCNAETSCGYELKNVLLPDELKRTRNFAITHDTLRNGETRSHIDDFTDLNTDNVNKYLMEEVGNITRENSYEITSFHDTGLEEVRLNLYWRKALEINRDRRDYPKFLLIPFFMASGSFSPTTISPSKIFAVPFGNNGHNAYGFTGGLNFDFFESLEIGGEAGLTHFGSRDICGFHVPNSPLQKGLYPFTTAVHYQPGHNWHCAAKFAAQHFLDKLSMFFQFVVVHHEQDCIKVKDSQTCCNGNPLNVCAFRPDVLEKRSSWSTKVGNLGLNYDLSPNIALGFLWQAPLSQRGTYRSSTVMLSVNGTY
jgi:hypothetical protein